MFESSPEGLNLQCMGQVKFDYLADGPAPLRLPKLTVRAG